MNKLSKKYLTKNTKKDYKFQRGSKYNILYTKYAKKYQKERKILPWKTISKE